MNEQEEYDNLIKNDILEEIEKVDVMINLHRKNESNFMLEQYLYLKDKFVEELNKKTHNN